MSFDNRPFKDLTDAQLDRLEKALLKLDKQGAPKPVGPYVGDAAAYAASIGIDLTPVQPLPSKPRIPRQSAPSGHGKPNSGPAPRPGLGSEAR